MEQARGEKEGGEVQTGEGEEMKDSLFFLLTGIVAGLAIAIIVAMLLI
jgi:hypothetical protein